MIDDGLMGTMDEMMSCAYVAIGDFWKTRTDDSCVLPEDADADVGAIGTTYLTVRLTYYIA